LARQNASISLYLLPSSAALAIPLTHTHEPTPVFDPNLKPSTTMCIADTRTECVAPKARRVGVETNPTPAFAVVAPAKRFDATEADARCVCSRRPFPRFMAWSVVSNTPPPRVACHSP